MGGLDVERLSYRISGEEQEGARGRERGQGLGLIQWQANSCSYNKCRREATNSERKTERRQAESNIMGEERGKGKRDEDGDGEGKGKTTAAKLHLNNENA